MCMKVVFIAVKVGTWEEWGVSIEFWSEKPKEYTSWTLRKDDNMKGMIKKLSVKF